MRFRKKPVEVEATQWFKNGDHPQDGKDTFTAPSDGKEYLREGKVVRYFRNPTVVHGTDRCGHCRAVFHVHGWIDTLEGGHIVCPGDWIVTGIKNERYPVKPSVFALTYEEVQEKPIYGLKGPIHHEPVTMDP